MNGIETAIASVIVLAILYKTGIGSALIARAAGVSSVARTTNNPMASGITDLIHAAETNEVILAVVAKLEREAKTEADRLKIESVVQSIRSAIAGGIAGPKS